MILIFSRTFQHKISNSPKFKDFPGHSRKKFKFQDIAGQWAPCSKAELVALKQFLRELKTGLKNLITQIRENIPKIYLATGFFKEYGSSEHINEIHAFLES